MEDKTDINVDTITVCYGDDTGFLNTLLEYGCVRVLNVFSPEECEAYRQGIFQFMESLGAGFDSKNPDSSWDPYVLPPMTRRGMIQCLVPGMKPFNDIRISLRMRHLFSLFYGTDDLIVSGDGMNFQPPRSEKELGDVKEWPHVDQRFAGIYCCVQSAVSLTKCDGGTIVWPKSHLIHEKLLETLGSKACKSLAEHTEVCERLLDEVGGKDRLLIPGEEGSVTLWLSTLIHSGMDPTTDWRIVLYISYRPSSPGTRGSVHTEDGIAVRAKAFRENRTTSHWGDYVFRLRPGKKKQYSHLHPKIIEYVDRPEMVPNIVKESDLGEQDRKLFGL